jgi:hypothetical protein
MDTVLVQAGTPSTRDILGTISEPMREWWGRVLRWWAVPLVLWLAWMLWYCAWYFPRAPELNWPDQTETLFICINNIIGLAFILAALVLWSLAAWQANQCISEEYAPDGSAGTGMLLPARFIAGLCQGWWPLGIVLAGRLFTAISAGLTSQSDDYPGLIWQTSLVFTLNAPFGLLAIMLWQCAICAVLHNQARLYWTWTAALLVLEHVVSWFISSVYALGIDMHMLNATAPPLNGWDWAVGLAVMLTLIEALRSRWQWLKYAVYSVVVASVIVAKLSIYNWWIWYAKFDSLGIEISNGLVMFTPWLKLFTYLPMSVIPAGMSTYAEPPDWALVLGNANWHAAGHPAWAVPAALLGNLLWFALLAALLYYVSLRPEREPADKAPL